jgi:hypothetical protein
VGNLSSRRLTALIVKSAWGVGVVAEKVKLMIHRPRGTGGFNLEGVHFPVTGFLIELQADQYAALPALHRLD